MFSLKSIPFISQRLTWLPTRLLFNFFGSMEIKGLENLDELKTNFIIASNHTSETDPILIVASLPFFSRHLPIFFVSREKSFYSHMGWRKFIYGGLLFKMWGAFQAHVGLKNYHLSLSDHIQILKSGKNILIFPVGTRNLQGLPRKATGGVSFLARETNLPIIPTLIQGVENLSLKNFFTFKKNIRVTFGRPLYTADIFKDPNNIILNEQQNDYELASQVIMEKIFKLV